MSKNICCGYNKPSAKGYSGAVASFMLKNTLKCTNKASLFENNKWYCKRHAPSMVEEREKKSWNTYVNKIMQKP